MLAGATRAVIHSWRIIDLIYIDPPFATNNTLLISEVIFSTFVGFSYYALSFWLTKNKIYLLICEVVLLWFFNLLLQWMGVSQLHVLYILGVICGVYLIVSRIIQSRYTQESELTLHLSIIAPIVIFTFGLVVPHTGDELLLLSIFPALYAILGFVFNRSVLFFGIHVLFELVAGYLFVFEFLNIGSKYEMLGMIYLGFAILYYVVSNLLKDNRDVSRAHLAGAIINAAWAIVFTFTVPKTGAVVAIIGAALSYHYHIANKQKYGLYVGSLLSVCALYQILRGWGVDLFWYPLAFIMLFLIKYVVYAVFIEKDFAKDLRTISLVGAFLSVPLFGIYSMIIHEFELSALMSAYILTVIIAFDAWHTREKYFGYLASFVGMITYFWQIKYLVQTEYQMYLLPLGIYFLVLSYFTKDEDNKDITQGLEYGGLFILLVPLLFQSFGENGFYYSLLLALEGIIVLVLGISTKKKIYRYVGIGAIVSSVFSQTYNYVFTLPRWVSTAIAGLTFISVAIFLLIKRKDIQKGK